MRSIRLNEQNYRVDHKDNEIIKEFIDSVKTVSHVPFISLKSKNDKLKLRCPSSCKYTKRRWERDDFKKLTKHILLDHSERCDIYRYFVCKKLKCGKRIIRKYLLANEAVIAKRLN